MVGGPGPGPAPGSGSRSGSDSDSGSDSGSQCRPRDWHSAPIPASFSSAMMLGRARALLVAPTVTVSIHF